MENAFTLLPTERTPRYRLFYINTNYNSRREIILRRIDYTNL